MPPMHWIPDVSCHVMACAWPEKEGQSKQKDTLSVPYFVSATKKETKNKKNKGSKEKDTLSVPNGKGTKNIQKLRGTMESLKGFT